MHFVNQFPGYMARPRVDMPPFNDKRVRQALSMATDRKQMNEATQKGRAEDDQYVQLDRAEPGLPQAGGPRPGREVLEVSTSRRRSS